MSDANATAQHDSGGNTGGSAAPPAAPPAPPQETPESVAAQLAREFPITEAGALLTVRRYWQAAGREALWRREVAAKCREPCLVAIRVFTDQRTYLDGFERTFVPEVLGRLPRVRDGSLGAAAVDAIRALHAAQQHGVFTLHVPRDDGGAPDTLEGLELSFQKMIVQEDVANVVGVVTAADGCVPLVDYFSARLRGASMEQLAAAAPRETPTAAAGVLPPLTEWRRQMGLPAADTARVFRRSVAARVNLFGNDPATSRSFRQNKRGAQQQLAAAGLSHIRSVVATSAAEADARREEAGIDFPVIVKPVSGAGSEFVSLCRSSADVAAAFAVTHNQQTTQSTAADVMVVEEYIEGDEYVVDTVSHNGVHTVTDVWQSWKEPMMSISTRLRESVRARLEREAAGDESKVPQKYTTTNLIYDKLMFVPSLAQQPPDCDARRATAYVLQVLDALGMRNGCSHCELRMRRPADGGAPTPVLIELNPRVQGDAPRSTNLVGYDQFVLFYYLAIAAAAVARAGGAEKEGEGEEGKKEGAAAGPLEVPWPPVPQLYTSAADDKTRGVLFLRSPVDGVLHGLGALRVMALPTYVRVTRGDLFAPLGSGLITTVSHTMDLFSSPAAVILEGTAAAIEADMRAIREMEAAQLPDAALALAIEVDRARRRVRALEHGGGGGHDGEGNDDPQYAINGLTVQMNAMSELFYEVVVGAPVTPLFISHTVLDVLRISRLYETLHPNSARAKAQEVMEAMAEAAAAAAEAEAGHSASSEPPSLSDAN